jgi:hypothetical protein
LNDQEQVLVKWKNHSPVYNIWLDVTPEITTAIDNFVAQDEDLLGSDLPILEAGVREAPRYPALNMRSSFANEFLSTYRAESHSIKTPSSNSLSTPLT